ncbi:GW domain-containing glycosaminoglycan-binding protein [Sporolactobacillus laevolacticus]|uniref:GW domain-containing protein n=1 Tax=Sporolactobacillus laevolacticus DSM 442 TaxID=1395513 RepID=V6IYW3_9BACL|nr:GW domain-containing glycosaminoglycan-binding protein [Sporolactobacillus laevolacticus]EST11976.1 hypothetical protein P343_09350 [Sporolactobacillus laevolacticus DSM 442]
MKQATKTTTFLLLFLLVFSFLSYYPAHAKASRTYYVHNTASFYSASNAKQQIGQIPINAKLKTTSKKTSRMYKVSYAGKTGYVYRSSLWTKRTTVKRYIHKTAYLYTGSTAAKQRIQTIAINNSLTTDSNLNNKMYHVTYKGKKGYVYATNLSTQKTPITKFVIKASTRYKNYAHTKKYKGTIPVNTVLTTTSPQSNKLYWVNYNGVNSYVYASNLANSQVNYSYNNPVAPDTYGVVSDGADHGIWDQPYGIAGAKSIGRIADYNLLPLTILRESKVSNTEWFQIGVDGQILGWVHKDTVQITSGTADDGSIPHLAVASVKNVNGQLYGTVNGTALPVFLNIYANLKLKIDQVADNGRWVHIKKYTAGTVLGWVKTDDLNVQDVVSSGTLNVNYNATISSDTAPIFDDRANFVGYSGQYNASNRVVQINQEKQVENEEMYRISFNHHVIGWVRSNALNLVNSTQDYKQVRDLNTNAGIYNGQSSGDAPDSNARIGNLGDYSNRMLEVIKQSDGWSFLKYNDWYGKPDKDIDIGWVQNDYLNDLRFQGFNDLFTADNGNQQGLAYNNEKNTFYVGYDLGNGMGKIIAYPLDENNQVINDQIRISKSLPLGHTCAVSYSPYTKRLYAVSSAGDSPKLYTIDPDTLTPESEDGVKINNQVIPYVAMMTVKDEHTLILMTESFGDDTFFDYDLNNPNNPLSNKVQLKKMGVVQGMQYDDGNLYFLTNNYITVLDQSMKLVDRFHFSIPNGELPQESEGLTRVNGKLVVGLSGHKIYIQQ